MLGTVTATVTATATVTVTVTVTVTGTVSPMPAPLNPRLRTLSFPNRNKPSQKDLRKLV